jgi:hypothetical protein
MIQPQVLIVEGFGDVGLMTFFHHKKSSINNEFQFSFQQKKIVVIETSEYYLGVDCLGLLLYGIRRLQDLVQLSDDHPNVLWSIPDGWMHCMYMYIIASLSGVCMYICLYDDHS